MTGLVLTREREWREGTGTRVAYAPDGRSWACSSSLRLHVYEDDALVASASAAGTLLGELAFALDGTRVLVAPLAYDRAARAWQPSPPMHELIAAGLPLAASAGLTASAGAWSPDGSALALYAEYRPPRGLPAREGWSGPAARLVLRDHERTRVLWEGARTDPHSAIVVGDDLVAAGGRAIDVRARPDGRPLAALAALPAVARVLRLDAQARRLAAGSADGTVAVWDAQTWNELARWQAHPGEAAGLAWRPDDGALATGGEDGAVRLWSPAGEQLAETMLDAPVKGLAFHPSGERLLAAQDGPDDAIVALAVSA
jgi:WD40 repeat protein